MNKSQRRETIWNFGRNQSCSPNASLLPRSEEDVLELLRQFRGHKIRARGSLHSWSRVAMTDDVSVDLSQLNFVKIAPNGDSACAEVGAGARIRDIIAQLNQYDLTLPSLGLITEQTIAGATSTATHGSGRHCLAHFIQKMRIATYDETGAAVIREVSSPEELNAARCALGTMGIITSITVDVRPQYRIEEQLRKYPTLDEVVDAEEQYPIQQFYLLPWNWNYFAQHRRVTELPRGGGVFFYRLFWSVVMDRALHWTVIPLCRWAPWSWTRAYFKWLLPFFVPRRWKVIDRSDRHLTMQHQLFRHIETEMFVRRSDLPQMMALTRWLIEWSAGLATSEGEWQEAVESCGVKSDLYELRGRYHHHYPICIRKVLPDDGYISMTGGEGEPWYAVSFISYAHPDCRDGFFRFSRALVRLTGHLFQARPHWGKWHDLNYEDFRQLYPRMDQFLKIRDEFDPTGAFRADWMPAPENKISN